MLRKGIVAGGVLLAAAALCSVVSAAERISESKIHKFAGFGEVHMKAGVFDDAQVSREAVPFDLPFTAIKGLDQSDGRMGIGLHGRALEVDPVGLVPNIALGYPYANAFGRLAVQQVMANFGKLTAHFVKKASPNLNAKILVPSGGGGGLGAALGAAALGTVGTVIGSYGATAQQQILNKGASDMLNSMTASPADLAAAQTGNAWQAEMEARTLALGAVGAFEDIDKLLEVSK